MFKDNANLLYLTFMKTILKDVHCVNMAFQHSNADVTKLYGDLRQLTYSFATRVLKERAIAETTKPGVLRLDEVEMLKAALKTSDNLIPIGKVQLGDAFTRMALQLNIPEKSLEQVRVDCANFLLTMYNQLLDRLPPNLEVIRKLQYLSPTSALAKKGRPSFSQLPLELGRYTYVYVIINIRFKKRRMD